MTKSGNKPLPSFDFRLNYSMVHNVCRLSAESVKKLSEELKLHRRPNSNISELTEKIQHSFDTYVHLESNECAWNIISEKDKKWNQEMIEWSNRGIELISLYSDGWGFGVSDNPENEIDQNHLNDYMNEIRKNIKNIKQIIEKNKIKNKCGRGRPSDDNKKILISSLMDIFSDLYKDRFNISTYEGAPPSGNAIMWVRGLINILNNILNNRRHPGIILQDLKTWADRPNALAGVIRHVKHQDKKRRQ